MRRELSGPLWLAVHVKDEDSQVAEVTVDPFPIGYRGLGSVAVLDVDGGLRPALVHLTLPEDLPTLKIQAVDLPVMDGLRKPGPVAPEIEPLLGLLRHSFISHGGEKDTLAPHHRTRPPATRQIAFPLHVLGRGPLLRQVLVSGHPPCPGTTELGPVVSLLRYGEAKPSRTGQQEDHEGENASGAVSIHALYLLKLGYRVNPEGPRRRFPLTRPPRYRQIP